jgi:hypothetical protein
MAQAQYKQAFQEQKKPYMMEVRRLQLYKNAKKSENN